MRNPEKLINNFCLRALVNTLGYKSSKFIIQRGLLPIIMPKKMMEMMTQNVSYYFHTFFPELSDEDAERKVNEFLWHYTSKLCEDCIALNFTFPKTRKLTDKYTIIAGRENLLKAIDKEQGILAVGSHIGSILWGTMAFLLTYLDIPKKNCYGINICTEPDAPRFPTIYKRLEDAFKIYHLDISFILTHRHKKDVGLNIRSALKARYLVTTNLDVLRGGGSKKKFKLFDKTLVYLPAIAGTAKIALQTGATILPWVNRRDKKGRLKITIEKPIGPLPKFKGKIYDDTPEFITVCEKLRVILERWIKDTPEQWAYWDRFHNRLITNSLGS